MIADIRNFFANLIAPAAGTSGVASQHALQLATAALLLEMMRMDGSVTADETAAVAKALESQFGLAAEEAAALMALATAEAREATDYFQFTSLINRRFTPEQKLRVVEAMWTVAWSDAELSAHERHLMRRIVDLLHVPHGDAVAAQARARARAGLRD